MSHKSRHPFFLLFGFWICVLIAIAVVVRRIVELSKPSGAATGMNAGIDASFAAHAPLTLTHIIAAAIFVLLAVGVLFRLSNAAWLQRAFLLFGAITGVTAYAMNRYAFGGWIERSAVLVFDTWFLISLLCAFVFYVRDEPMKNRQWTTRAVGILLGIATTRPVMGVFFATSKLSQLSPQQFFGIAFWIGFSINVGITELWLRSGSREQLYGIDQGARRLA